MLFDLEERKPSVHPSCFVADSAQLIGSVALAQDASVWFNCVLRGDNDLLSIGPQSNVQDGTIIHVMHDTHPTIVGNDVTLGHGVIAHGCTIHDRVLIGMGAVLLNGAEIGEDSIVAAGSLVTEGARVPPRSLVMGSPARVKRTLDDGQVASILEYASNYVRYRLEYMGGH